MDSLASTLPNLASSHPKDRFLVAIAGAPGSGKTTLATALAAEINRERQAKAEQSNGTVSGSSVRVPTHKATVLSMDGFHLPRSTLDALPAGKREEAYIRRGAPWTFDVNAFVQFMKQLRAWADRPYLNSNPSAYPSPPRSHTGEIEIEIEKEQEEEEEIYAPTFSHSTKDPVPNGLKIPNDTSILIIEGNYLLLDEPLWRDIASLVDYRVFVDVDLGEARERLARRHVEAGIEETLEDGYRRVDANDYLNGVLVKERLVQGVDVVVRSERKPQDLRV